MDLIEASVLYYLMDSSDEDRGGAHSYSGTTPRCASYYAPALPGPLVPAGPSMHEIQAAQDLVNTKIDDLFHNMIARERGLKGARS